MSGRVLRAHVDDHAALVIGAVLGSLGLGKAKDRRVITPSADAFIGAEVGAGCVYGFGGGIGGRHLSGGPARP